MDINNLLPSFIISHVSLCAACIPTNTHIHTYTSIAAIQASHKERRLREFYLLNCAPRALIRLHACSWPRSKLSMRLSFTFTTKNPHTYKVALLLRSLIYIRVCAGAGINAHNNSFSLRILLHLFLALFLSHECIFRLSRHIVKSLYLCFLRG